MGRSSRFFFTSALAASALGACSSTPAPNDAGTPVDVVVSADVPATPADSGLADVPAADRGRPMRAPQPIYGACTSNAECEEGLTCRTEGESGVPGGQCNRECTRDDDCVLGGEAPADGYCTPATTANPRRLCQRVCVNGIDCERPGFTCQLISQLTMLRVCIPVCTAESCVDGTTCNPGSNRCERASMPSTGAAFGAPCRAPNDPMISTETRCPSNLCFAENNFDSNGRPVPTGWVGGGMCISRCILPQGYNSSTLWPERELPQANCPNDAVCFPNGTLTRGDLGLCLKECTANTDCRPGFFCRKTYQLGMGRTTTFNNGYCTPVNCAAAGMSCPAGHTCRMSSATAGICVSNATGM
jgi:hypothetical protein